MAIDTAAKRRNVGGLPFWVASPGVTPDATPGAAWRQQAGWGYGGIPAGEAEAVVSSATRYRYGYRLNWQHALMLWIWGWYAARG